MKSNSKLNALSQHSPRFAFRAFSMVGVTRGHDEQPTTFTKRGGAVLPDLSPAKLNHSHYLSSIGCVCLTAHVPTPQTGIADIISAFFAACFFIIVGIVIGACVYAYLTRRLK